MLKPKIDYLVYVENWLIDRNMHRICDAYPNCIRKKRDNQKIKATDELLDDSLPRCCSLNGGQMKVCRLVKSREVSQEMLDLREKLHNKRIVMAMHRKNEKWLISTGLIHSGGAWIYDAINKTKSDIKTIKEQLGRFDIEPLRFSCDDQKIIDMF